ncbi:MAG: 1-acyl-sn-glycerol-3-phosphate acyltransferase [Treponema sp.]|jgi:1-acyl-sn-glycerol-3-phosphate acyltransferase|nr:1-acyl-sn-glycerol-3-phosphate acyltransferase [Treponema sp.]
MIKTVICFAFVVAAVFVLIPLGIVVVVFSLLGLRKPMSILMYRIAQGWALFMIKLIGCKVTVKGRENIPRKEGVCFVSNHGSIFDILLLLAYTGRPFGFIAKKELLLIPFLNLWISVLGGLFIDRKNARKAVRTISKGVARIRAGGAMIIFPEGHRSRGQGLLPFHPGSFKLATHAEAVIVPVALAGTYDVFEKNYRVKRVPVEITFCKAIKTSAIPPTGQKQILSDQIYGVIKEALDNENREAAGPQVCAK